MSTATVPNRPFASDLVTGLMLPDGIFVTALGPQRINAQIQNTGSAALGTASVYVESVSDPGIALIPGTHTVWDLDGGATTAVWWEADFSSCPAGEHYVSIIVETAAGKTRIIKKIFVLGVEFNETTATFKAVCPEGVMLARFNSLVTPRGGTCPEGHGGRCCCCCDKPGRHAHKHAGSQGDRRAAGHDIAARRVSIDDMVRMFREHPTDFRACPPGYLPKDVEFVWIPTPRYAGQHGDLPFEDPWWKLVLCILAFLLLIASAIAEALDGTGTVYVGTDGGSDADDCCGIDSGGGGTSYIAAALLAAAAAAATIAALTDERDAFRRGQDATPPDTVSEETVAESFKVVFNYTEPVALGKPFRIGADWRYERQTTARLYSTGASEVQTNIHVLSKYEIEAPDVAKAYDPDDLWKIKGRFYDADGDPVGGDRLFVQCFLVGPNGEWFVIPMLDDGEWPDETAGDFEFTGYFPFNRKHTRGLWEYYVIAQDINTATPDLTPEEAAKIIGGMVVTHQLTLSFSGGECRFVPDGHVNVL